MGWLMQVLSVRGAQESASGLSCVVQTRGGGGLDGHRVSRTHDSEICFTGCARPKLGLRAGPATPHWFVTHRNAFTSIAIVPNLVPWRHSRLDINLLIITWLR